MGQRARPVPTSIQTEQKAGVARIHSGEDDRVTRAGAELEAVRATPDSSERRWQERATDAWGWFGHGAEPARAALWSAAVVPRAAVLRHAAPSAGTTNGAAVR